VNGFPNRAAANPSRDIVFRDVSISSQRAFINDVFAVKQGAGPADQMSPFTLGRLFDAGRPHRERTARTSRDSPPKRPCEPTQAIGKSRISSTIWAGFLPIRDAGFGAAATRRAGSVVVAAIRRSASVKRFLGSDCLMWEYGLVVRTVPEADGE